MDAWEIVGVFDSDAKMQKAIDQLLISGFNHADVTLLASEETIEKTPDLAWHTSQHLEDDPETPRAAYVSPESFGDAQGALIATLIYIGAVGTAGLIIGGSGPLGGAIVTIAVAGGLGGAVGTLLARILKKHHAHDLADHLARGGLLLWVRTPSAFKQARATEILRQYGATDVHAHDLPLVDQASPQAAK